MIGSTISHYVVEDLLGEGGMGKVYRARDTVLNRTVAIKILGTSVGGDSESKRRILREARAACALNHPNVVTIHSVEEERELDFIVMEHVAGAPLTIPLLACRSIRRSITPFRSPPRWRPLTKPASSTRTSSQPT